MIAQPEFWTRVDLTSTDGCWPWTGSHGTTGYGQLQIGGQKIGAHRRAWELTFGPIPEGMYICHHCDNPPCVRPDHLYVGTASDNNHDAVVRGRRSTREPIQHGRACQTRPGVPHLPVEGCRTGRHYWKDGKWVGSRRMRGEMPRDPIAIAVTNNKSAHGRACLIRCGESHLPGPGCRTRAKVWWDGKWLPCPLRQDWATRNTDFGGTGVTEAIGRLGPNGASCCLACGELLRPWGDGYGHARGWCQEGA